MKSDLTSPETTDATLLQQAAMEAARRYAKKSRSESTWRTYESAWRLFDECFAVLASRA